MATGREMVSRIGDVVTVTTDRYFFRCAVCGNKINKGENVLKYLHNIGLSTDHVHENGCNERYLEKYLVTPELVYPESLTQRAYSLALRRSLADEGIMRIGASYAASSWKFGTHSKP